MFSDILSEHVDAVEGNLVSEQDLSGLVCKLLSSLVAVESENDALELLDSVDNVLPHLAEVAAVW